MANAYGYSHNNKLCGVNGIAVGPAGFEVDIADRYGLNVFHNDGLVYYVDGNAGKDTNNGLSWEASFKTLAVAFAASHASIASSPKGTGRGWAARNTIYIKGDSFEESLTVFPQKTDIIGVGSCDFLAKPQIIGVQANATAVMGCRFINVAFNNTTADETVNVKQYSHGISFINCDFLGNATTTIALLINDCANASVIGCKFMGTTYGVKQLVGLQVSGVGTNNNLRILNNYFNCAVGITIDDTNVVDGIIAENYLDVTTLAIDENADRMIVANNMWISAAVVASSYDLAVTKCVGNLATGSDVTRAVPQIAAPV